MRRAAGPGGLAEEAAAVGPGAAAGLGLCWDVLALNPKP